MATQQEDNRDKNSLKDYFRLGEVFGYWFRKKDENRPSNFNIRTMHTINKISMVMFLVCVIVIVVRAILRA